jgi:hypothetical protein
MATTNFLPFNPSLINAEDDATYLADALRTGGAPVDALIPSPLFNKLMAQPSMFAAAFCEALVGKGISTSDANFTNLIAALANVLTTADVIGFHTQTSYNSGGRVLGTIYQNTGATPRMITVTLGAAGAWSSVVSCDASSTPGTQVASMGGLGASASCTFLVLPNYYYYVYGVAGSPIIDNWTEWQ